VRVSEYERDKEARPSHRQDIDIHVSAEAFGAGIGRGLVHLGAGMEEIAQASARMQALEDESKAREARNAYIRSKDILLYGDTDTSGYTVSEGRSAIDGFAAYKKGLMNLKRQHGANLTPAQRKLFEQAVEPLEIDATKTALIHKGTALKSYIVEQAKAGAENFKTQAVRAHNNPQLWQKYTKAGLSELDTLSQRLGWSEQMRFSAEREFLSNTHKLTALEISSHDPVAALDYVVRNRHAFSPSDHITLMGDLAKTVVPIATRDAIEQRKHNPVSSIEAIVKQIIKVESGAKTDSKAQNSDASSAGQFTDTIWLAIIGRHRPDLTEGRSKAQILSLKTNAALSREMTRRYAEDNIAALRASGIVPTGANLYAAHFLGPAGAKAVLLSSDERMLSDIVPQAVMEANSFLNGKDVSWFKLWMQGKMADSMTNTMRFSKDIENLLSQLPHNYASRIRESAAVGMINFDTQQAAASSAQKTNLKEHYQLRLAQKDMTLSRDEILCDPILDDGDKAQLLTAWQTKFNDDLSIAQALSSFSQGERLFLDPYSAASHKLVDGLWDRITTTLEHEQLAPTLMRLVLETGLVPQAVMHTIRAGLESTNQDSMAQAATMALQLYDIDPAALGRRDGGNKIRNDAVTFSHLTKTIGLSQQKAAQRMIDRRNPDGRAARKALMETKATKDWIASSASKNNVRDIFDKGWFAFDPELGRTPLQSAVMVGEYRSILEESLYESAGDKGEALALADDRFKRIYGVSQFMKDGTDYVYRLPPEVTYPLGTDGSHTYIRDQIIEALKEEGIKTERFYLMPDTKTEEDFHAGRPARYKLWYMSNEDGVMQEFPRYFFATPPTKEEIEAVKGQHLEKERDKKMEWEVERRRIIKEMHNNPILVR